MLQIKNVSKSYRTASFSQTALNNISIDFRESEFVAILGPSGSGKTTCLNIVGGLDRYDSGDIVINGKSTKNFTDKDWDAYRNNSIGFIFQNYNLISHLTVLENVELGMTLSGISASKRRVKAKELLGKVGLKDHMRKNPDSCPAVKCSGSPLRARSRTTPTSSLRTNRPARWTPRPAFRLWN